MSDRSPELLIEDVLESAAKIKRYTSGMPFEQFRSDEKTVDAVIRNFEIIGEAAGRLTDDFRKANSQIDWKKSAGSETVSFTIISELTSLLFGTLFRTTWTN